MGPSGSTYPHELLERTVTLFGDEVIPRFDKDPEHSTSKYRAAAARADGSAQHRSEKSENSVTDGLEHPDLAGVAGEMRAEWRAEQEAAATDAAAQWRHGRTLADWLRERMHAGDRIAVHVGDQSFVGLRRGDRRRPARHPRRRTAGSTCTSSPGCRSRSRCTTTRPKAGAARVQPPDVP